MRTEVFKVVLVYYVEGKMKSIIMLRSGIRTTTIFDLDNDKYFAYTTGDGFPSEFHLTKQEVIEWVNDSMLENEELIFDKSGFIYYFDDDSGQVEMEYTLNKLSLVSKDKMPIDCKGCGYPTMAKGLCSQCSPPFISKDN